ncbi:MAG: hypothetical protein ABIR81_08965 [Ginsengibacter sp.]
MKTNKAIGTIVGFEASIFEQDEGLKDNWVFQAMMLKVDALILEGSFAYNGLKYKLKGTQIKDDHYETLIYCDNLKCGTFSVTLYSGRQGYMLFGDWHERLTL